MSPTRFSPLADELVRQFAQSLGLDVVHPRPRHEVQHVADHAAVAEQAFGDAVLDVACSGGYCATAPSAVVGAMCGTLNGPFGRFAYARSLRVPTK